MAGAKLVHHIVDEGEILQNKVALGNLFLLAEVDQLALETVAHRAEFVLHQQRARVLTVIDVPLVQLPQLARCGLDQRRNRDRLLGAQRYVAHPDLHRIEERVRTNVPPDFLGVVDAVGLDQKIHVALELRVAIEVVGQIGAREVLEHLGPVALISRFHAHPEGRIGG